MITRNFLGDYTRVVWLETKVTALFGQRKFPTNVCKLIKIMFPGSYKL